MVATHEAGRTCLCRGSGPPRCGFGSALSPGGSQHLVVGIDLAADLLLLASRSRTAASLLGLLAYPVWVARIAVQRRRHFGDRWPDCWLYGLSCMLGKFPQMLGQLTYWGRRLTRRPSTVIEYKGPMANKPVG